MYQCQICQSVVPAKTRAVRVVLETRVRTYPPQRRMHPPKDLSNRERKKLLRKLAAGLADRHDDTFKKWVDDPGGRGLEVVREVLACPACAAKQGVTHQNLSRG